MRQHDGHCSCHGDDDDMMMMMMMEEGVGFIYLNEREEKRTDMLILKKGSRSVLIGFTYSHA